MNSIKGEIKMNIYKIDNHDEIITNSQINKIIRLAMFNPTDGRVKTVADGIYGKQQGSFYVCEMEDVVGIIGVKRVDNAYVQIMHLAVEEDFRKQGIARALLEYVKQAERVDEILVETDGKDLKVLKKLGFRFKKEDDNRTGLVRFIGRQEG